LLGRGWWCGADGCPGGLFLLAEVCAAASYIRNYLSAHFPKLFQEGPRTSDHDVIIISIVLALLTIPTRLVVVGDDEACSGRVGVFSFALF
jgi:hypothetical protein